MYNMDMTDEISRKNILDLIEENEMNVSRLYALYAGKIPGHRVFWLDLSSEELGHAANIRAMRKKMPDATFEENNFTRGALRYVFDFLQEKLQEAGEKSISHADALGNALRIEQSILEKKCFEFFLPNDKELKTVMENINRETESHVSKLRDELARQD